MRLVFTPNGWADYTYWLAADALVQQLGKKEGGLDKLKGKKIALVTTSDESPAPAAHYLAGQNSKARATRFPICIRSARASMSAGSAGLAGGWRSPRSKHDPRSDRARAVHAHAAAQMFPQSQVWPPERP